MAPYVGFDTEQIKDKARKDLLYLLILAIFNFRCFRPSVWLLARRPPWADSIRFIHQLIPGLRDVLHVNKRLLRPGKDSTLFSRFLSLEYSL